MANDQSRIREIAWMELFPWLGLVRAVRLAFSPRMLILAAIGLAATIAGWGAIGWAFSRSEDTSFRDAYREIEQWHESPSAPVARNTLDGVTIFDPPAPDNLDKPRVPFAIPGVSVRVLDPADSQATLPWNMLSKPFRRLFDKEITVTSFLYLMACGVWALLVWSLFGAAITRSAALWFAREDRLGFRRSLIWGMLKWPAYFGGPMFPFAGVFFAVFPIFFLSLLLRLDLGVFLVGIIWPLVLLCGFFLAILLVGLLFGWPLMWPTISAEGTDSFDALSRSYSYTYQRPVHYLFYAAVAGVLGALAWVVVMIFANGVIEYSYWAASWGGGVERMEEIRLAAAQEERLPGQSWVFYSGAQAIGFWVSVVITIAVGFLFSYFWCAATYIYFLLRQAVDATEMDEVAVDEEPETYGLPPLQTEPGGVPQVSDAPVASTAPGSSADPNAQE